MAYTEMAAVGLLVGPVHALARIKSPAPPVIATAGLGGMLITATWWSTL